MVRVNEVSMYSAQPRVWYAVSALISFLLYILQFAGPLSRPEDTLGQKNPFGSLGRYY